MQNFLATINGVKIKSLDEILGVIDDTPTIDPELDRKLDVAVLKKFKGMQNGWLWFAD